ncbi:MAG: hypothetical protein JW842_06865, partial [Prolixibacteraceae bacterium]|nr:hypothetical protein [Prolixibacteraceae bacterium]
DKMIIFDKKIKMDIATRKISFVQRFLQLSNEESIRKLEKILYSEIKDKEHFSPMTMDEFNEMIDKSEYDHKNGNVIDANDLLKQIDEW